METTQDKWTYRQGGTRAQTCNVLQFVANESARQPLLAHVQLRRASLYLRQFPDLNFARRAEIDKVYNKLQKHVQEVDEALTNYRRLIGIMECNKGFPVPVDPDGELNGNPLTLDDWRKMIAPKLDEARERARRAQEKNTRLINELATLCPVTSNHYTLRPQAVIGKKHGN